MKIINGAVFTGYTPNLNEKAMLIMDQAVKINDNGKIFPVFGISQGQLLMAQLTSSFANNKTLEDLKVKGNAKL